MLVPIGLPVLLDRKRPPTALSPISINPLHLAKLFDVLCETIALWQR